MHNLQKKDVNRLQKRFIDVAFQDQNANEGYFLSTFRALIWHYERSYKSPDDRLSAWDLWLCTMFCESIY